MTDDDELTLDDPEHRLALQNVLAQESLLQALVQAREAAGLTQEQVAERLGTTVEIVQQVEAFAYDLTLSELRRYAFAVDAFIEYEVEASTEPDGEVG